MNNNFFEDESLKPTDITTKDGDKYFRELVKLNLRPEFNYLMSKKFTTEHIQYEMRTEYVYDDNAPDPTRLRKLYDLPELFEKHKFNKKEFEKDIMEKTVESVDKMIEIFKEVSPIEFVLYPMIDWFKDSKTSFLRYSTLFLPKRIPGTKITPREKLDRMSGKMGGMF